MLHDLPGLNTPVHVCCMHCATGSCEELQAEHNRLQDLLHTITAADASAKATPPAVEDSNGRMLELLLEWRQQRQAAITAEMARLQEQLAQCAGRLAKQGATGANQKLQSPAEELLQWIEQNGGKVCWVDAPLSRMTVQPTRPCSTATWQ